MVRKLSFTSGIILGEASYSTCIDLPVHVLDLFRGGETYLLFILFDSFGVEIG